jgi:hypothetical protein
VQLFIAVAVGESAARAASMLELVPLSTELVVSLLHAVRSRRMLRFLMAYLLELRRVLA